MNSREPDLFEQIITRIHTAITTYNVQITEVIDSHEMMPEVFLDRNLEKETILLTHYSRTNAFKAIGNLLAKSENLLKSAPKDQLSFASLYYACVYFCLVTKCCKHRPEVDGDEVLEENSIKSVIFQSDLVFKTDFGKYNKFILSYFSNMLSQLGIHSSRIYLQFLQVIQDEITKTTTTKQLAISLKPLSYLPANVYRLKVLFKFLVPYFVTINPKFHQTYCDMLTAAINTAFKRGMVTYYDFVRSEKDIDQAIVLLDNIMKWNEKNSWATQFSIILIAPSILYKQNIEGSKHILNQLKDYHKKSSYKEQPLQCVLVGFRALALSNNEQKLYDYMKDYYHSMMKWWGSAKILPDPFFASCQMVDFPICTLFIKPDDFDKKIVPVLLSEKRQENWIYMAKVIKRLCKQSNELPHPQYSLVDHLIDPCVKLIKKVKDDPKLKLIEQLFSAFQLFPYLFRKLIFSSLDIFPMCWRGIQQNNTLTYQHAFVKMFNSKFAEDTVMDADYWIIYINLLEKLLEAFYSIYMYNPTQFSAAVPQIILRTAEALLLYYQTIDQEERPELRAIVVSKFETASILFLASSNKNIRRAGVSILTSLLGIIHAADFTARQLPVDRYLQLVTEASNAANLTTAHSTITNNLKAITELTEGLTDASEILCKYFASLSLSINPNLNIKSNIASINKEKSIQSDEWIGCMSILCAIAGTSQLYRFLSPMFREMLCDTGDLGALITVILPNCINNASLVNLANSCHQWASQIVSTDFKEVKAVADCFMMNIMRIFHKLLEQKAWSTKTIDITSMGDFIRIIVTYCDLISGEEFRMTAALCIISLLKLFNSKELSFSPNFRHSITKILLVWLPDDNLKTSKEYTTAVQTALAMMLDNLALIDCVDPNDPKKPEEQVESTFMFYFSAIKAKLDSQKINALDMIPILAALLKQNLTIGIEHCFSMGFTESSTVRAAFIGSVASVFKVPEAKVNEEDEKQNLNLIDYLFDGGFDLIELIAGLIPYSNADAFGGAAVEGAILRNIEFEFLTRMIELEVRTIDPNSKNTLFRGNAVPARAVGHFPRVVGMEWMASTLRPLFERVIERCAQGIRYQVDPNKIDPKDDMETNRKNFRDLLNECIDVIYAARDKMPVGMIREAQILYVKVNEKYGDFSFQILCGFLFLRFMFPAFTLTKNVGLPEMIDMIPRQALLQASAVLMLAALRGQLDDKGDNYMMFNDIAKRCYDVFMEMFVEIINKDIGDEKDEYHIDEEKVVSKLHCELWQAMGQIASSVADMEENEPVKIHANKLLQKVQSMGQPQSLAKKPMPAAIKTVDGKKASLYENLMSMKYADDILQNMEGLIVREDHQASDGSAIFIIYTEKFRDVQDTNLVPYLLMHALDKESMATVTLVIILNHFDDSKIPLANMLNSYAEMKPALKIVRYIFLEPSVDFVQFFARLPQVILEKPNRFIFIRDANQLTDIIGAISDKIPQSSLESLAKSSSVAPARINNVNYSVRLHNQSIQFVSLENVSVLLGPEKQKNNLQAIRVIMTNMILHISNQTESVNKEKHKIKSFIITLKDQEKLTVIEKESSALHENMITLIHRNRTLQNFKSHVKIDTSTLQWLMMNLAFVNMVNESADAIVRKAALDLIYAAFSSFDFQHKLTVSKLPISALPENLLGFVSSLSDDLAVHNPECYFGFINEFWKVFGPINHQVKAVTFHYLRSWLIPWIEDIDSHPELFDKLLDAYKELPQDKDTFALNVFPAICGNPHAVDILMHKVYESADEVYFDLITGLAEINSPVVSALWADKIFTECIEKKDERIIYVTKAISSIIVSHLFDNENQIVSLVYHIVHMRNAYNQAILSQMYDIIGNVFHTLVWASNQSLDLDFKTTCLAFCTIHDEFDRKFFVETGQVAFGLQQALPESDLEKLHEKFLGDIDSDDLKIKYHGIILACAFSSQPFKSAKFLVELALKDPSPGTVSAIATGMTLLEMDQTLCSKLFYVSLCFCIYTSNDTCLDLLISSLVNQEETEVFSSVNDDLVIKLEEKLTLPLSSMPVYSTILIFSKYGTPECKSLIPQILASFSDEILLSVFSLLQNDDKLKDLIDVDFGDKGMTIAITALNLLNIFPSKPLLDFVKKFAEKSPNKFSFFTTSYNTDLLIKLNDPYLASLIMLACLNKDKDNENLLDPVPSLVLQTENGPPSPTLTADELKEYLTNLF